MAQIAIRMPKMSMTMTEGEVSEWFVGVGDTVSEGDVICEVLTDKVDMEVESPATGVVSSIVVESGSVDVGTPIGYLEGEDTSGGFGDLLANVGDAAAAPATEDNDEAAGGDAAFDVGTTPTPEPEPAKPAGPPAAVPRARTVAVDAGVDPATLKGSGPDGLIVMADVESLASGANGRAATSPASSAPAAPAPAAPAAPDAAAPAPVAPAPAAPAQPAAAAKSGTAQPSAKRVALVRARVAAKMTESAAVPQFTVWRDLLLDEPNTRRAGVSWNTVLLSAYSAALSEVPELLCRWDGSAAVESGPPSVGLAIATPYGLLAPVLLEPHREDPHELNQRIRALVTTAQTGRVDTAYLRVANGMVSNLGGLGVDRFQALVTPPQASVLSVGSITQRPVAVVGGVGTALSVTVGLTIDHRVADGAHAAQLLTLLADNVTQWGKSDPASTSD